MPILCLDGPKVDDFAVHFTVPHHLKNKPFDLQRSMSFLCRSGRFYLYKRVPRRFYPIETRRHIYISLKSDSLEVAKAKALKVWREVLAS